MVIVGIVVNSGSNDCKQVVNEVFSVTGLTKTHLIDKVIRTDGLIYT